MSLVKRFGGRRLGDWLLAVMKEELGTLGASLSCSMNFRHFVSLSICHPYRKSSSLVLSVMYIARAQASFPSLHLPADRLRSLAHQGRPILVHQGEMFVARIRPAVVPLAGAEAGVKPSGGGGRRRRGVARTGLAVGGHREEQRKHDEVVVERSAAVPVDVEEMSSVSDGERKQGKSKGQGARAAGKGGRMHDDNKTSTRAEGKGRRELSPSGSDRAEGKGSRSEHKQKGGDVRENKPPRSSKETWERRGKAGMPLTAAQEGSEKSVSAGKWTSTNRCRSTSSL